ncbi:hypothetical protein [Marispirochaeta aestuarii]|uniref:hypothetical protein n=1 Tax=Marispirochaeta aestuarii TaxID=1963862 RepID=UPI0029C66951|nr:hypothetical protein [Marispirochaeta aestuarii]
MNANRKRSYQILAEGTITRIEDERLSSWKFQSLEDGKTLMTGPQIDSSGLYGILSALRDSGIVLLGIKELRESHRSEGDKK